MDAIAFVRFFLPCFSRSEQRLQDREQSAGDVHLEKDVSLPNSSVASAESLLTVHVVDNTARIPLFLPVCEAYKSKFKHCIELKTLKPADQAITWALQELKPTCQNYAYSSDSSYCKAFNWDTIFKLVKERAEDLGYLWPQQRRYHVIAFYSQLKAREEVPGARYAELSLLDEAALEEAVAGGGLLRYWFGELDGNLRNLATCIWRSKEEAHKVHYGPYHAKASKIGTPNYEDFEIQEWELVVEAGMQEFDVNFKANVHLGRTL